MLTFAVGVIDSYEEHMDLIATAGGTGEGYQIGATNAEADLLAALLAIGQASGGCTFALPESGPNGEALDPGLVNVTVSSYGTSATIGQVSSAEACGDQGGWYYDDPTAPTSITLCPASCAAVSEGAATVDIVMGCVTEVQ